MFVRLAERSPPVIAPGRPRSDSRLEPGFQVERWIGSQQRQEVLRHVVDVGRDWAPGQVEGGLRVSVLGIPKRVKRFSLGSIFRSLSRLSIDTDGNGIVELSVRLKRLSTSPRVMPPLAGKPRSVRTSFRSMLELLVIPRALRI
jgi:hypothetical protein